MRNGALRVGPTEGMEAPVQVNVIDHYNASGALRQRQA